MMRSKAAIALRMEGQKESVDRSADHKFIAELRKNAMLSPEYKDHLILLYLSGVHDAYHRGKKSK